jgi:hypothetical protein
VIGTFHAQLQSAQTSHTTPKYHASNAQTNPTPTPPTGKTSEVNVIQSTPTSKNKSKKRKGRNKEDKNKNPQSDKAKTRPAKNKDKHKPHYPCLICGDDHYTEDCPRRVEVTKFLQGTPKPPTPVVLSQPFPSQQQAQLVIHDQPSSTTTSYVLMGNSDSKKNDITLTTRAKYYPSSKEKVDDIPPSLVQQSPSAPPSNDPLHLERPNPDTVLRPPPKGVVRKSAFNPHARVDHNYSIVEYLAQAPSTMSALEVLQSCPTQWKALLKAIDAIDPTDTNLIIFDLEDHIPRLPPQLAFRIQVVVSDKNICRTFIDEGASMCVMSIASWKDIGSPPLTESHNTLKAFNGSGFKPYGVLPSVLITLEGKTINVEVEVFDTPLDYNLLLGRSWINSMRAVVSTLFWIVHFPHQGKVVTVDQLAFFNSDTRTSNIPFIAKTPLGYKNVGMGLLKDSTLMGTFPIPPPEIPPPLVALINMISTSVRETHSSFDPCLIPEPDDYSRYGE